MYTAETLATAKPLLRNANTYEEARFFVYNSKTVENQALRCPPRMHVVLLRRVLRARIGLFTRRRPCVFFPLFYMPCRLLGCFHRLPACCDRARWTTTVVALSSSVSQLERLRMTSKCRSRTVFTEVSRADHPVDVYWLWMSRLRKRNWSGPSRLSLLFCAQNKDMDWWMCFLPSIFWSALCEGIASSSQMFEHRTLQMSEISRPYSCQCFPFYGQFILAICKTSVNFSCKQWEFGCDGQKSSCAKVAAARLHNFIIQLWKKHSVASGNSCSWISWDAVEVFSLFQL